MRRFLKVISDFNLGEFFSHYESDGVVSSIISKTVVSTGKSELHVTVICKRYLSIPDTLLRQEKKIFLITKRRPLLELWQHGTFVPGVSRKDAGVIDIVYLQS